MNLSSGNDLQSRRNSVAAAIISIIRHEKMAETRRWYLCRLIAEPEIYETFSLG